MLSNLRHHECCLSGEERIQLENSKRIDRELSALKRRYQATQKIVLLGAGESGKSTFLKQMQIIHGSGFSKDELIVYRTQVYENILKGMVGLINGKTELKLPWRGNGKENPSDITLKMKNLVGQFRVIYKSLMDDRDKQAQTLHKQIHILPDDILSNNVIDIIIQLWNDLSIQEAFIRRREFPRYFVENVPFYFQNLDRIARRVSILVLPKYLMIIIFLLNMIKTFWSFLSFGKNGSYLIAQK